ncbi:hypothetical protein VNO78_24612 [Psophocarpus tetragonolobus]|uniref:2-methoxy-6-polyprenyl-1,4-benzoquinol methylase, mitochondrial n=1 Tax=Psophocarpus tetragonolobus TaxID=3891 RepID=A0AAN9XEU4_PSOTE
MLKGYSKLSVEELLKPEGQEIYSRVQKPHSIPTPLLHLFAVTHPATTAAPSHRRRLPASPYTPPRRRRLSRAVCLSHTQPPLPHPAPPPSFVATPSSVPSHPPSVVAAVRRRHTLLRAVVDSAAPSSPRCLSSSFFFFKFRSPWLETFSALVCVGSLRANSLCWKGRFSSKLKLVKLEHKVVDIKETMALGTVTRRLGFLPALSPSPRLLLHSHATSFGFKQVNEEEKSRMVGDVFTSVASKYDLMNDLMSAGLHRLWKDRLVSMLNPFPGMKHLDLAGGTGDVAFRILENINKVKLRGLRGAFQDNLEAETRIYVCDINPNMLNVGKKRAMEKGFGEDGSLIWEEGNAESLSFQTDSMDGYTIAFGIRNVTHIEEVLSEAHRVLKPGGRFLCLELSHVGIPIFKDLYDYYSFSVIPYVGELVAGDRDSYQYLVESIRRFPSQEKFASMIADAGFEKVEYENLVGGVVAIHSGIKI